LESVFKGERIPEDIKQRAKELAHEHGFQEYLGGFF